MNETKKEPTTTELFSTARDGIHGRILDSTADGAISELERRMGAMERALRIVAAAGVDARWIENGTRVHMQKEVAEALTNAPPVFTLEEVVQLVHEAYTPWVSRDEVRESVQHHHATMRR